MKTFIIFIGAIFAASAADLDLNKMCYGILFATLPHPDDQNLFIGCIQGRGTLLGCNDADDIFDPIAVSCKNRFITTTRSPLEQACDDSSQGMLPSDDDCRDYVVCESSGPAVRRCPDNTIFDPLLPGCVFGNSVTCEIFVPTTQPPVTEPPPTNPPTWAPTDVPTEVPTLPPTTIPPTTLPPATLPPTTLSPTTVEGGPTAPPPITFVCPVEGFGNIPHQTICDRYFECVQGIRFARTCDPGQIFDVITKRCDLRESSICAVDIRCN